MQQIRDKLSSGFRWGIPASVVGHIAVIALLYFGLPLPELTPSEEPPAIAVEMVPPPEEVAPQAEPEPEAESEPENEPETPAGETAPEETTEEAAEEGVEQIEPEQPVAEPEPAPEEQAAAEPVAEEPAPEEPAAEEQPAQAEPVDEEPAVAEPDPVPVEAGDEPASSEPASELEPEPELEPEAVPEPAEATVEAEQAETEQANDTQQSGEGEAQTLRTLNPVFEFGEEDGGPELAEDGNSALSGQDDTASLQADSEAPGIIVVPLPQPRPEDAEAAARKLNSEQDTGAETATTAIADIPRSQRGADLCATELREQLRHSNPPVWPDLIPAYRLGNGTAINVATGAFHASGQWYNLSFRCEVNDAVTRVISFDLKVGASIPKSQWKARGFPDF